MAQKERDWTGNRTSIFKTLGASSHTNEGRQENDWYATDEKAIDILCGVEQFDGPIWECAAGDGRLSRRLEQFGYKVFSSDLIQRHEDVKGGVDFLKCTQPFLGNIITNPPYKYATEFIYKALELIPEGKRLAMFLKILFLEGKERKKLFTKYPPETIYISSSRITCAKNADFEKMKAGGGSAVAYCWMVWNKGKYNDPVLKWVN